MFLSKKKSTYFLMFCIISTFYFVCLCLLLIKLFVFIFFCLIVFNFCGVWLIVLLPWIIGTFLRRIKERKNTKMLELGTVEKAEEEKNYGTLEVVLRYDPASQCLHCKVERARNLRPMDIHGLADPFCKLNIIPIGPSTTTTSRLRTKTVHKTRDPEFNEQLNFYGIMENDVKKKMLFH